jgi:hypothetical protein
MNQQPDKLFRDKLQSYQRPVPPMVWKRIAEKHTLRDRKLLWLKMAASVLLLATAGALIFPFLNDQASPVAENKQETTPVTIDSLAGRHVEKTEQPAMQHDTSTNTAEKARKAPSIAKEHAAKQPSGSLRRVLSEKLQQTTPPVNFSSEVEPVISPELTTQLTSAPTPADDEIAPRKTVTIVFTAEEVNQKYLSRPNGAQATSEGKESSRLQNLLDKAQDLKHNQDPLGEIRQKKNEILAMNFRKEKLSTQND